MCFRCFKLCADDIAEHMCMAELGNSQLFALSETLLSFDMPWAVMIQFWAHISDFTIFSVVTLLFYFLSLIAACDV